MSTSSSWHVTADTFASSVMDTLRPIFDSTHPDSHKQMYMMDPWCEWGDGAMLLAAGRWLCEYLGIQPSNALVQLYGACPDEIVRQRCIARLAEWANVQDVSVLQQQIVKSNMFEYMLQQHQQHCQTPECTVFRMNIILTCPPGLMKTSISQEAFGMFAKPFLTPSSSSTVHHQQEQQQVTTKEWIKAAWSQQQHDEQLLLLDQLNDASVAAITCRATSMLLALAEVIACSGMVVVLPYEWAQGPSCSYVRDLWVRSMATMDRQVWVYDHPVEQAVVCGRSFYIPLEEEEEEEVDFHVPVVVMSSSATTTANVVYCDVGTILQDIDTHLSFNTIRRTRQLALSSSTKRRRFVELGEWFGWTTSTIEFGDTTTTNLRNVFSNTDHDNDNDAPPQKRQRIQYTDQHASSSSSSSSSKTNQEVVVVKPEATVAVWKRPCMKSLKQQQNKLQFDQDHPDQKGWPLVYIKPKSIQTATRAMPRLIVFPFSNKHPGRCKVILGQPGQFVMGATLILFDPPPGVTLYAVMALLLSPSAEEWVVDWQDPYRILTCPVPLDGLEMLHDFGLQLAQGIMTRSDERYVRFVSQLYCTTT